MEADQKTCPKCAEAIKAQATLCRFCGHFFPTVDAQPRAKSRAAKGLRIGGLGIAIILAFLILVGIFAKDPKTTQPDTTATSAPDTVAAPAQAEARPPAEAPTTVNATEISALELDNAFKANEVAAHQKYGDTPLLVTGSVTSIALDFSNSPYVTLAGQNPFVGVQAALGDGSKEKSAKIHKGQKLILLCMGKTELTIGFVHLSQCEIQ